jgi:hypothetical protein
MNPLRDPFGFDRLEQAERVTEQVPLDCAIPADPLDAMLSRLESSIEQPLAPELDVFADPLAGTLDQIESSIEGDRHAESHLGLDPLLAQIEMETERQVIQPEAEPLDAASGLPPAASGRPQPLVGGGRPPGLRKPEVGLAHTGRGSRRYAYRPSGSGSGFRRQTARVHCALWGEWVYAEECRECTDFEPTNESAGDDEEHCRFASDDLD